MGKNVFSVTIEEKILKKWKEYSRPIIVDFSGEIEFYVQDENENRSHTQRSTFFKMDKNWSVELVNPYSDQYTGGGKDGLIDQLRGGENFADGSWQGFNGNDFIATIDLGKIQSISEISVGFLQAQRSWIWLPLSLDFSISEDNINFNKLDTREVGDFQKLEETMIKSFGTNFKKTQARYVRIHAKNRGVCPEWHPGAGGKAWLFVDEIDIN